jgi:hypothetical protein
MINIGAGDVSVANTDADAADTGATDEIAAEGTANTARFLFLSSFIQLSLPNIGCPSDHPDTTTTY